MTTEQQLVSAREWGSSALIVSLWAKLAAFYILLTYSSFDDLMARLVAVGLCLAAVGTTQMGLAIRIEYLNRKIARQEKSHD